jgi:hypothetical protein
MKASLVNNLSAREFYICRLRMRVFKSDYSLQLLGYVLKMLRVGVRFPAQGEVVHFSTTSKWVLSPTFLLDDYGKT